MRNGLTIWNEVCTRTVGVDGEGGEVQTVTGLGLIAQSMGVPIYTWSSLMPNTPTKTLVASVEKYPNQASYVKAIEGRKAIADFLRQWADSVEAGE